MPTPTAAEERTRIAAHLRDTAAKLLVTAIESDQYNLERAEHTAAVLEETATSIENGEHLS